MAGVSGKFRFEQLMVKQPSEKDKKQFRRAMQELESGDPAKAIRLFGKVRKSWRDNPDICYLEGLAYGKLGKMEMARQVSEHALKLEPRHYGALCNLANAQMSLGDHEHALDNYARALEIKPDSPDVLDNYGRALAMLGRRNEAIAHYKQALQSRPDFAPAHTSLAKAYREAGNPAAATEEFERALEIDPGETEAHLGMGFIFSGLGGIPKARHHFSEALKLSSQCVKAYTGLANLERYMGNFDQALEYVETAGKYLPEDDPALLAIKADVLERSGRSEEAYSILDKLAAQNRMTSVAVTTFSRVCRKYDVCDKALEKINDLMGAVWVDEMERKALCFAAGELLDKLCRYDEAFEFFQRANDVVDISCNRAMERRLVDELIGNFNKEAMAALPRASVSSSRPVFIVGMPRSGTSLTEQILSSHPDVYGAGELPDLQAMTSMLNKNNLAEPWMYATHISAISRDQLDKLAHMYLDVLNNLDAGSRYVTDKLPHNFQRLGLINLLFPECRIIHCRRNPMDTCLSIYFQDFVLSHDYASDLSDLGFFYSEYERLMRHWEAVIDIPMMTVQYEDLIDDQETMSRQILDFCGLDWDESVMAFHDSARAVATASYDQVRQPIYKTSRERWKNYEEHLSPLLDAFSGQVMERLGAAKDKIDA